MYHILYVTINLINGKFYIGKHSTEKIDDGYLGSGYVFKSAIKKYGRQNFRRLDLEFFKDEQSALEKERRIINEDFLIKYKDDCYNIGCGGFGGDNISLHPNHDEIVKRMTDSITKKWQDPEYHSRVNKKRAESMRTDRHRQLRSSIAKNLWSNNDHRIKITNAIREAQKSEKCTLNRIKGAKRMWGDQQQRAKRISLMKSELFRNNMSKAIKQMHSNHPEIKLKQKNKMIETMKTPESKKRMSEAAKNRYKNSKKMQNTLKNRMGNRNPCYGSKWMYNPQTLETSKIQPDNIQSLLSSGWIFGRKKIKK